MKSVAAKLHAEVGARARTSRIPFDDREWWRPISSRDHLGLVTTALRVLLRSVEEMVTLTQEDANAVDDRVKLLRALIVEFDRPERRDPWLTVLNRHVSHRFGEETDKQWSSLVKLYQSMPQIHAARAHLDRLPMVMFSRCQGKSRKQPAVWQLWIREGKEGPWSVREPPYMSKRPVFDLALVRPADDEDAAPCPPLSTSEPEQPSAQPAPEPGSGALQPAPNSHSAPATRPFEPSQRNPRPPLVLSEVAVQSTAELLRLLCTVSVVVLVGLLAFTAIAATSAAAGSVLDLARAVRELVLSGGWPRMHM